MTSLEKKKKRADFFSHDRLLLCLKREFVEKMVAWCAESLATLLVFCHAVLSCREAESKSLTYIAEHIRHGN